MIQLYQKIALNRDFPEHHLKQGDIATLIDIVPHPDRAEDGYILEIFNALGESINTIIVPKSAVVPLQANEIFSVRPFVQLS